MKTLVTGFLLSGLVSGIVLGVSGRSAFGGALTFGLVATAIQVGAARAMRGAASLPFSGFVARWGLGMALRFGGIVLLAGAIVADRTRFPPLPTALGFLGVLIPLLFLEWRLSR